MSIYSRGLNHSPTIGGTGLNIDQVDQGSLLIGNGVDFDLTTLTAGVGITIVNGDGSITISGTALYTLPIASDTLLGGIKVGSGLSIDGGGVLSAERESIYHGGTLVGTRPNLNLIDGTNVALIVADNSGTNAVDVTVDAVADKKWIILDDGGTTAVLADGDESIIENVLHFSEIGSGSTWQLPDVTTISSGLLVSFKVTGGPLILQPFTGQKIDGIVDNILTTPDSLLQATITLMSDNVTDNAPGWDLISYSTRAVEDRGDFVKLDEVEVTGSVASSIIFNSIDSGYRNLKILFTGRGDNFATVGSVNMFFNGDTGSHYAVQHITSTNSTVTSVGTTSTNSPKVGSIIFAGATGNSPGSMEITIFNYTNTNFDTDYISNGYSLVPGITSTTTLYTGVWLNTAVVTSLTLKASSGSNFVIGTVATLYGIK